jgi:hypothetical protein
MKVRIVTPKTVLLGQLTRDLDSATLEHNSVSAELEKRKSSVIQAAGGTRDLEMLVEAGAMALQALKDKIALIDAAEAAMVALELEVGD